MTYLQFHMSNLQKKPMRDIIKAWRAGIQCTQQTFNFIRLKENITAAVMKVWSLKTCKFGKIYIVLACWNSLYLVGSNVQNPERRPIFEKPARQKEALKEDVSRVRETRTYGNPTFTSYNKYIP